MVIYLVSLGILGGLRECCKLPPRGVWAEPQPKLNLVHFGVKHDICWEQFYLFCKELTDQIQYSLSRSKKAWWHHKFEKKMGATSNCERSFFFPFPFLFPFYFPFPSAPPSSFSFFLPSFFCHYHKS